jgi:cell division protein ZapD
MVRIQLPLAAPVVPEISANRYALNIRFLSLAEDARNRPTEHDIDFDLTFCNL